MDSSGLKTAPISKVADAAIELDWDSSSWTLDRLLLKRERRRTEYEMWIDDSLRKKSCKASSSSNHHYICSQSQATSVLNLKLYLQSNLELIYLYSSSTLNLRSQPCQGKRLCILSLLYDLQSSKPLLLHPSQTTSILQGLVARSSRADCWVQACSNTIHRRSA